MKNPVTSLLSETFRGSRHNEALKMVATLSVITVMGVGVAAAAISIGPEGGDPSMRPLSYAPALMLAPAFGEDDEDCTIATLRQILPDGSVRIRRNLTCEQ